MHLFPQLQHPQGAGSSPAAPGGNSSADASPTGDFPAPQRRWWVLAALAFGLMPFVSRYLFDLQLSAMVTASVNALQLEGQHHVRIHLVKVAFRVLLPLLALLALLRFTPLGRWFGLTPLGLACLLVADAGLFLLLADQFAWAVFSGARVLPGILREAVPGVTGVAFSVAGGLLVLGTAWYRSARLRQYLLSSAGRWWREV